MNEFNTLSVSCAVASGIVLGSSWEGQERIFLDERSASRSEVLPMSRRSSHPSGLWKLLIT